MIVQPKMELVSSLRRLSSYAAASVGALGFVVLIGWGLKIPALKSLLPDFGATGLSTALSFALAGLSLWYAGQSSPARPLRWAVLGCPIAVMGLAALTFFGHGLRRIPWFGQSLLPNEMSGPAILYLDRMALVSAGSFLLLGFALVLFSMRIPRRYVYAQCCATLVGLLSLLFLMENGYTFLLHSGAARYKSIVLVSSLAFLLLSLGVLFVHSDRGVWSVITEAGSGGRLLRRGLVITVAVSFLICWLATVGWQAGYYGTEFRMALVATSLIGVFSTLIWGYAASLVFTESKRKRAENLLNGQKQVFEMISRGASLEETLSALIRVMEAEEAGYVCTVLLLDQDGVHLRHGAAPTLPPGFAKAVDGQAIGPQAGSCGTAAYRREPVLVQDIATDPLWSAYKHLALPHGLRACWSTPILDENRVVLGTFAIYGSKPIQLTPQFLAHVDLATHAAAIGIKRHRAEEELRANLVHLSMVYNSVADVIFHVRVEPQGQFRFDSVNHAFYKVTGLQESQVIGKLVQEVIPEPSVPLILEKYQEAIRTRQTVRWEEETPYPDGTKSGEVSATPVFDSEGHCTSLIGSVHDLTERKRLEHQFRQAQKMEVVGQLAGGVAHDFNNLLTIINGYSEIMLQELAADNPHHVYAAEIKKAGDRAASLTHQLLAFSRRQVLKPQVLDLNSSITKMEKMLRRLIGEHVQMMTVPGTDLGRVKADPGQVEQIIVNLAVNARDAMPQGGKLTFETANVTLGESYAANHLTVKPGPYVMLAVSDTGVGMDAETQKHIFEPFFTTKEVGKGTGLGLSTVYGIVKQSDGNIWVYSEPGLGTTFKIYLPRVDKPVEIAGTAPEEAGLHSGTETILLVEDEPSVRLLVRTTLESNGYQVLEAANGAEALLIGEQHTGRIHFLLTDLVMPGINGRALAEQLAPLRPELKVLFLSGYTDDAVIRHGGLEAGKAFLQKPFTPDALARKVREVMDEGPKNLA
jgi:two-component system, cell cycle sensor histidine kinase and response regulator CckA